MIINEYNPIPNSCQENSLQFPVIWPRSQNSSDYYILNSSIFNYSKVNHDF